MSQWSQNKEYNKNSRFNKEIVKKFTSLQNSAVYFSVVGSQNKAYNKKYGHKTRNIIRKYGHNSRNIIRILFWACFLIIFLVL